jgi:hypothetical protein
VIPAFLCPSDSSLGAGFVVDAAGVRWGLISYGGNAWLAINWTSDGDVKDYARRRSLESGFPDGTETTIMLTEKAGRCETPARPGTGSEWGYASEREPLTFNYAAFAAPFTAGATGPGSFPQFANEFKWNVDCDPTRAASPHTGGINVAFVSGGVRFVSQDVCKSKGFWWALVTPDGCELVALED